MTPEELIAQAKLAMSHAYAPYSKCQVGAALLTAEGRVYHGCNVENAAYTPTVCAERTAFLQAVYDGVREFAAIAVAGGRDGRITGYFPPCGVCRQMMREFCNNSFLIYIAGSGGAYLTKTLGELLPNSFSSSDFLQCLDSSDF